ncbi:sugar ABC transporter substrate-binding protein [Devosia sp. 2618]|uniref:ABC transporter substrate-binding protein n=1 Tax=Devosia sp. 2618 TaxID=3156454 RepID=UPI00339A3DFB
MSDLKLTRRQSLVLGAGALFALGTRGAFSQDATTLTFWSVRLNTPELQAALLPILAQFEAEHPGIKVVNEPVSGNLVYPKFLTAVQGQLMPDVAEAYSYHPLQFAALGQMAEMDDLIKSWETSGRLKDVVNEFAYKKFFWNDHYWGVPYNLDPRAIYYRKDLLEAKGIKPPTNWDEFQAAAIALNDPANGVYGLSFPAGNFHITQHFFMGFMFQAGGSILDKDGNLVFGTTARDANIRALTYLTDFATKHKVTPEGIGSWDTPDAHTFFQQGRAAFGMGTGVLIGEIQRGNPDLIDKIGILETLQGPAAKLTAGFFNPMFVWNYSPAKEAAMTFVDWFTQPGRLEPLYAANPGGLWPIFKSEFDSELTRSQPLMQEMLAKVIPYTTDFAYPGTGVPEMGVIDGEKMFAAPVNEVVIGQKTPAQAIDDAQAKMAALWEE